MTDSISMTGRRKYHVYTQLFDPPYDSACAYILGFLAGDGWVTRYKVCVFLAKRDRDFVIKLRDYMRVEHPIKDYVKINKVTGTVTEASGFEICSKQLVASLKKFGVVPNKTHTYDPKATLDELPIMLHRHFFRGLIDADGCLGLYKNDTQPYFNLTGSKGACDHLRAYAIKNGVIANSHVLPKKRSFRYALQSWKDVKCVCNLLYKKGDFCLERKHDIATKIAEAHLK